MKRTDALIWRMLMAAEVSGAGWWTVWRHGGNRNHRLESVWGGGYREAELHYAALRSLIRQGRILLVGPDGTIVREHVVPRVRRLRSVW